MPEQAGYMVSGSHSSQGDGCGGAGCGGRGGVGGEAGTGGATGGATGGGGGGATGGGGGGGGATGGGGGGGGATGGGGGFVDEGRLTKTHTKKIIPDTANIIKVSISSILYLETRNFHQKVES